MTPTRAIMWALAGISCIAAWGMPTDSTRLVPKAFAPTADTLAVAREMLLAEDEFLTPGTLPPSDPVDTVTPDGDTMPVMLKRSRQPDWWWTHIKEGTYDIKDKNIIYPGFVGFCVDVYNWADGFFNTYDTDYVLPTGLKWKGTVRLNNWTDSYILELGGTHVSMLSDIYSNVGPVLTFMAVSVSYDANLNQLISHKPTQRKRLELNFNTALFWINAYYSSNRDGTSIRTLGNYRDAEGKRLLNYHLNDMSLRNMGVDVYYFVNHKRYSQAAAYNFGRYQRRSQGSLLLGATVSHQDIRLDLSHLPADMLREFPKGANLNYVFDYNDFCLLLGYGHNWVAGSHWLFNVTALPSVGFKHSMRNSTAGRRDMFSVNGKGMASVTYNCNRIFAGMQAMADLHWFNSSRYNFANAVLTLCLQGGFRF